jgi:hypothetical protein
MGWRQTRRSFDDHASIASEASRVAFSLIGRSACLFDFGISFVRSCWTSASRVGRSACSWKRPSDPTGRLKTTPGFAVIAAMPSRFAADEPHIAVPWSGSETACRSWPYGRAARCHSTGGVSVEICIRGLDDNLIFDIALPIDCRRHARPLTGPPTQRAARRQRSV